MDATKYDLQPNSQFEIFLYRRETQANKKKKGRGGERETCQEKKENNQSGGMYTVCEIYFYR